MDKEQKSFMYFAIIVILVAMILIFSAFKTKENTESSQTDVLNSGYSPSSQSFQ